MDPNNQPPFLSESETNQSGQLEILFFFSAHFVSLSLKLLIWNDNQNTPHFEKKNKNKITVAPDRKVVVVGI